MRATSQCDRTFFKRPQSSRSRGAQCGLSESARELARARCNSRVRILAHHSCAMDRALAEIIMQIIRLPSVSHNACAWSRVFVDCPESSGGAAAMSIIHYSAEASPSFASRCSSTFAAACDGSSGNAAMNRPSSPACDTRSAARARPLWLVHKTTFLS